MNWLDCLALGLWCASVIGVGFAVTAWVLFRLSISPTPLSAPHRAASLPTSPSGRTSGDGASLSQLRDLDIALSRAFGWRAPEGRQ